MLYKCNPIEHLNCKRENILIRSCALCAFSNSSNIV